MITNILIINKAWAEANNASRPVDRRRGIENAASFRANGTGPFRVRERQPGVRTVLGVHTRWWGQRESNLDEVVFLPIANDGTRVAALLTGEVDVIDPVPLQDMVRVKAAPGLSVRQTPESRIVFLGSSQKTENKAR